MKRMKPEKKRLIVSIVAVVLIIAMLLSIIAPFVYGAEPADDITVEAAVGFDGCVKMGNPAMFAVNIKNNSDSHTFFGEINIPIICGQTAYAYNRNILSTAVELAPSAERTYKLYAPSISFIENEYEITVVNDKGKPAAACITQADMRDEYQLWTGILSNSPEKLAYMKPEYQMDNAYSFILTSESFPDKTDNLQNFNVLIINKFDMNMLSEQQLNTLCSWLYNGGRLIIGECSGDAIELLSSDEFGSAAPFTLNNISSYSPYTRTTPENYNEIVMKKVGSGNIYFFNVDLSNQLLQSSSSFSVFDASGEAVYHIGLIGIINTLYTDISSDINNMAESYKNQKNQLGLYSLRLPAADDSMIKAIFSIIYIYIMIIGPVLYLFLAVKKKKEKAIVIIPAAAVAAVMIIYLISLTSSYKKPILNIVSYINLNNSLNGQTDMIAAAAVLAPRNGSLNISADSSIGMLSPDNNAYYRDYSSYTNQKTNNENEYKTTLLTEFGDTNKLTYYDYTKWESNNIKATTPVTVNDGIDFDISIENLHISGKITNNTGYDLFDVVLGINNNFIKLDSLKNGESYTLTQEDVQKLDLSESGNEQYILTDGSRADKSGLDSHRLFQLETREDIVNSIRNEISSSMSTLVFIAFNEYEFYNNLIEVNGQTPNYSYNNIFFAKKEIDMFNADNGGIPFGAIKPECISQNAAVMDGYLYVANQLPVEMSFQLPKSNPKSFVIRWAADANEFSIYNYSLKSWESLYLNVDYSVPMINDYINSNGEIVIRISDFINGGDIIPESVDSAEFTAVVPEIMLIY